MPTLPRPSAARRPALALASSLALAPGLALAARPTEGGGLHPYDSTDEVASFDSPEGLVRVHYSRGGPNAALPDDDDEDGVPDLVSEVALSAEAALDVYRAVGFRLPLAESALDLDPLGGSDALDVYLVDFGGVADGQFAVDRCRAGACAGHLLIENDFAGYGYPSLADAVAVLTSHELFHGVQFAYTDTLSVWMSEGGAVWAEHLFHPGVDDFLRLCGAYQRDLARPFDSPPAGTVTAASYGVGLLFAYLVERSEEGLMVGLLESAEGLDGEVGLDTLLAASAAWDLDLAAEWPIFAAWNLASGRRAGGEPTFSFGAALGGVSLSGSAPAGPEEAAIFDERLYPLAALFYRVTHEGGPLALQLDEGAPGVWLEIWPVEGGGADGPVGPPLVGVSVEGPQLIDLEEQPAGAYLIALSHAGIGASSLRPTLCAGGPEARAAACPDDAPDGAEDSGDGGDGADSGGDQAPSDASGPEDAQPAEAGGAKGGCMSAAPVGAWALLGAAAALLRRRRLAALALLTACVPLDDDLRKGPPGGDSGVTGGGTGVDSASDGGGGSADSAADSGATDGGGDAADGGDGGSDEGSDGGATEPTLPDEVRGIWITRYVWSDEDDLRRVLDEVADAGFNAVFFQCRGTYDAYYESSFEPWAQRLSGTLGRDPGWDPLAVAIEVSHGRGMQLHAYINAVPLWQGASPPVESSPRHALLEHPDWLVAGADGTPMALNSSYVYASLGHPAVRQRIADVAADIADHYDVDGVHLDYIRYPASDMSHDAVSEAAYADDDGGLSYGDWQRARVVEAVQGVNDGVTIPVSAAVWGVYENDWGWSSVSQGNVDYYQDSRAFTTTGAADAIMPMIYWPNTSTPGGRLDFRTLIADHVAHNAPGAVVAGVGNTITFEQLVDCIRTARDEGARGVVVFDYSLFADRLGELAAVFAEAD
jgi:uncharacterized lipoprotein YddW (UPF0748 family)